MPHTIIPHSRPYVGTAEKHALAAVIDSGYLAGGPRVCQLEAVLSKRAGHSCGAAVSSGTAALYLALKALKVKKNDYVIMPSFVCTALLHAVLATGAKPLLCDVDRDTGLLTSAEIKKVLRKKTAAIIAPHLFGNSSNIKDISRYGIPVIEDCAQYIAPTQAVKNTSVTADISVFSFYATKLISAGEGGMVTSSNRSIINKIKDMREYDNRESFTPSFNYKMSDLNAAVALAQLEKLDEMIRIRRSIAARYSDVLKKAPGIILPVVSSVNSPIYYRFVVLSESLSVSTVIARFKKLGIAACRPIFKPLHHYVKQGGFPNTDSWYNSAVSIPIYPGLTKSETGRIVEALEKVFVRPVGM